MVACPRLRYGSWCLSAPGWTPVHGVWTSPRLTRQQQGHLGMVMVVATAAWWCTSWTLGRWSRSRSRCWGHPPTPGGSSCRRTWRRRTRWGRAWGRRGSARAPRWGGVGRLPPAAMAPVVRVRRWLRPGTGYRPGTHFELCVLKLFGLSDDARTHSQPCQSHHSALVPYSTVPCTMPSPSIPCRRLTPAPSTRRIAPLPVPVIPLISSSRPRPGPCVPGSRGPPALPALRFRVGGPHRLPDARGGQPAAGGAAGPGGARQPAAADGAANCRVAGRAGGARHQAAPRDLRGGAGDGGEVRRCGGGLWQGAQVQHREPGMAVCTCLSCHVPPLYPTPALHTCRRARAAGWTTVLLGAEELGRKYGREDNRFELIVGVA